MLNLIENEVSERVVSNVCCRVCMIADDSPLVRKIVRKALSSMSFEFDEAENGQIALDKCRIQMPDVILLDWNMPVMNGREFLLSLRRTDGGNVPNVIFCTTETDVEHVRLAMDAGADDYLMKPFDTESLCKAFARITYR